MYRYTFAACALLGFTSIGWTGAETYFVERSHDFGATPRGPQLTHYFRFTNSGNETLVISALRVSCGCVVASAPVAEIKPGESSYITAQMDSRRFAGLKAVTIYVQFAAPQREEITLLVKANGRDDLAVVPESFALGSIRKGSASKASVQITFRGDLNWKIEGVRSDSSHVRAEAKLLKRNGAEVTYEVTATVQPDLPVGKWLTDIWLESNDPTLGKTRIPLTVDVNAAVTASPEVLQLGEVKIGDSVEQNVILRGDKPFKIKAIRSNEASVQVSGNSTEAKNVHVIKITFKPVMPGEVNRAVTIVTEDGEELAVSIPLVARAVKE